MNSKVFEDRGDPKLTPFVRFISGTPLYPKPTIYGDAKGVLAELRDDNFRAVLERFVTRGTVASQFDVLLESTWFGVFELFLTYSGESEQISQWQRHCLSGLRLMAISESQLAWDGLRQYLVNNIDEIGGWASSHRKYFAERDKVVRADDGGYYRRDTDGTMVRVIGAETFPETRLDFLTDQILWRHGFLRQFIELFCYFAITDDFQRHGDHYPLSMKAVVPEFKYQSLGHGWNLMYFDRTRSVKWRPYSNLCDPQWLAADLLSRIVDTLNIDFFQKRKEQMRADENWMSDTSRFQLEYVLDSNVRIGPEDEAFITFEGKNFRWINGTAEHSATVSVSVDSLTDNKQDIGRLNRMLSAIVWHQKTPVAKQWGAGGPRRPYPTAYGPRTSFGIQLEPQWLHQTLSTPRTAEQWFALALFREGINSRSDFYSYLCFWKVVEYALDGKQRDWINKHAAGQSRQKERIAEISKTHSDLAKYFWDTRRNAIAHVLRKTVDPDDPQDEIEIKKDTQVMQDFARLAIEDVMGMKR